MAIISTLVKEVTRQLEVMEEKEVEVTTKGQMRAGMRSLILNVLIVTNIVITLGSVEVMLKRRLILLMISMKRKSQLCC